METSQPTRDPQRKCKEASKAQVTSTNEGTFTFATDVHIINSSADPTNHETAYQTIHTQSFEHNESKPSMQADYTMACSAQESVGVIRLDDGTACTQADDADEYTQAGKESNGNDLSHVTEMISENSGLERKRATHKTESRYARKFKELLESGKCKEFVPASKVEQYKDNVDPVYYTGAASNDGNHETLQTIHDTALVYPANAHSNFLPHDPNTHLPLANFDSNFSPHYLDASGFMLRQPYIFPGLDNTSDLLQYFETNTNLFSDCNGNRRQTFSVGAPSDMPLAAQDFMDCNIFYRTGTEENPRLSHSVIHGPTNSIPVAVSNMNNRVICSTSINTSSAVEYAIRHNLYQCATSDCPAMSAATATPAINYKCATSIPLSKSPTKNAPNTSIANTAAIDSNGNTLSEASLKNIAAQNAPNTQAICATSIPPPKSLNSSVTRSDSEIHVTTNGENIFKTQAQTNDNEETNTVRGRDSSSNAAPESRASNDQAVGMTNDPPVQSLISSNAFTNATDSEGELDTASANNTPNSHARDSHNIIPAETTTNISPTNDRTSNAPSTDQNDTTNNSITISQAAGQTQNSPANIAINIVSSEVKTRNAPGTSTLSNIPSKKAMNNLAKNRPISKAPSTNPTRKTAYCNSITNIADAKGANSNTRNTGSISSVGFSGTTNIGEGRGTSSSASAKGTATYASYMNVSKHASTDDATLNDFLLHNLENRPGTKEKTKKKSKQKQRSEEADKVTEDFIQSIEKFIEKLRDEEGGVRAEVWKSAFKSLNEHKDQWLSNLAGKLRLEDIQSRREKVEDRLDKIQKALNHSESTSRKKLTTLAHKLKNCVESYQTEKKEQCGLEDPLSVDGAKNSKDDSDKSEKAVLSVSPSFLESPDTNNNQNHERNRNENCHNDESSCTLPPFLRIEDKIRREETRGRKKKRPLRTKPVTVQSDQSESILHVTVHPSELNQHVNVSVREKSYGPDYPLSHRPPIQRDRTAQRSLGTRPLNTDIQNNSTEANTERTGPNAATEVETPRSNAPNSVIPPSNVELSLEPFSRQIGNLLQQSIDSMDKAKNTYITQFRNPSSVLEKALGTIILNQINFQSMWGMILLFHALNNNFQQQKNPRSQRQLRRNRRNAATRSRITHPRDVQNVSQQSTQRTRFHSAAINSNDTSSNLPGAILSATLNSHVQLDSATANEGSMRSLRNKISNASETDNTITSERDDFSLHISGVSSNPIESTTCATITLTNSDNTSDVPENAPNAENTDESNVNESINVNSTQERFQSDVSVQNYRQQHHQNESNDVSVMDLNRNPIQQNDQNRFDSDFIVCKGRDGSYTLDATYLLHLRGNSDIQFYKDIDTWKYRYFNGGDNCNLCLAGPTNSHYENAASNQRTTIRTSHDNFNTPNNSRPSVYLNRLSLNPYQNISTDLSSNHRTFTGSMSSARQVAMIFPHVNDDAYLSGMNSLVILEAEGLLVALDLRNCCLKTFTIFSQESRPIVRRKDSLNLGHQPLAACKLDKSEVAVAKMGSKLTIVKCVRSRGPPQVNYELSTEVQYSGLAHVKDNVLACSCYSQGRVDVITVRDRQLEVMTIVQNDLEKPEVLCFLSRAELVVFLARGADGAKLVGVDRTSKEITFVREIDSDLDNYWSIAQYCDTIVLCCTNTNKVFQYSSAGDMLGEINFPVHALDRPSGLVFDVKEVLFVANEGVHNNGIPPYTKPDIRAFCIS